VAIASDQADAPARAQGDAAALRRIWLCADDYGIAPGVSKAIRDLVLRERLNATSVMVVAPSFSRAEAVALSILNAGGARVAIGLHLALTAPFRPLAKDFAPLADGVFLPLEALMREAFLRRLDAKRMEAEIRAQLAAFTAAFGRPPDFIDGHRHVHLLPRVSTALLAAAKEVAPKAWVRQCGQPGRLRRPWTDPKGAVIDLLSRGFRRRAAKVGLATNPSFAGTYTYADDADFAALFPHFLAATQDGGLIMCHPGAVDAELERVDPLTHLREREYAYLRGEEFTGALAQHGVALA
jgi:predicted glycoside hydrolase/deacetylase ChbG (UPF0249 family)